MGEREKSRLAVVPTGTQCLGDIERKTGKGKEKAPGGIYPTMNRID